MNRVHHKTKNWTGTVISTQDDLFGSPQRVLIDWDQTGKHVWYNASNRDIVALDKINEGLVHTDIRDDEVADAIESSVTVPKNWEIYTEDTAPARLLVSAPGIAPDTDDPGSTKMFPSGMVGDVVGEISVENVVRHAIVQFGISAMHEAMECIRIDGNTVAAPHPEDEGGMWDWMRDRFLEIYDEYLERWPNAT